MSPRIRAGNDMLRMAAVIMALPNNAGAYLKALQPIRIGECVHCDARLHSLVARARVCVQRIGSTSSAGVP